MDKQVRGPSAKRSLPQRLWNFFTSRKARSIELQVGGLIGGVCFGVFIDAPLWIRAMIGLFTWVLAWQVNLVHVLGAKIDDMLPGSAPVNKLITEQGQTLVESGKKAVAAVEDRLHSMVGALPGLFTLGADPRYERSLSKIGDSIRRAPEHSATALGRIVALSLEKVSSDVESAAKSKLVIRNEPEMADPRWKAIFEPSTSGEVIVATSWVSPEWWRINQVWMNENKAAIEKGLQVARIFILEDSKELEASTGIMREQAKQGVQVNHVLVDQLQDRGLAPRDMAVAGCKVPNLYDPINSDKLLLEGSVFGEQILEMGYQPDGTRNQGYRLVSTSIELSVYPPEVERARAYLERIYRMSVRYDDEEWWSYFFDEDYTTITRYKESTADNEAEALIKAIKLRSGMRILDLGCAYGRLEQRLKKFKGVEIIPVEYSSKLLKNGVSKSPNAFPLKGVKSTDMRLINKLYKEEFDVVMSTFTSWGYFNEADNEAMFKKVFAVLKPGGLLYLDVATPSFIRRNTHLVEYPSDNNTIRRCDAVQEFVESGLDKRPVKVARRLSQFAVVSPTGAVRSKPLVSLRLYELNELRTIATNEGFDFLQAQDEKGREWADDLLPQPERLIVVMQKPLF